MKRTRIGVLARSAIATRIIATGISRKKILNFCLVGLKKFFIVGVAGLPAGRQGSPSERQPDKVILAGTFVRAEDQRPLSLTLFTRGSKKDRTSGLSDVNGTLPARLNDSAVRAGATELKCVPIGGRCWDRTSDLSDVNGTLCH